MIDSRSLLVTPKTILPLNLKPKLNIARRTKNTGKRNFVKMPQPERQQWRQLVGQSFTAELPKAHSPYEDLFYKTRTT